MSPRPRRPCSAAPAGGHTGPPARGRRRSAPGRALTGEGGSHHTAGAQAPGQRDRVPEVRVRPDTAEIDHARFLTAAPGLKGRLYVGPAVRGSHPSGSFSAMFLPSQGRTGGSAGRASRRHCLPSMRRVGPGPLHPGGRRTPARSRHVRTSERPGNPEYVCPPPDSSPRVHGASTVSLSGRSAFDGPCRSSRPSHPSLTRRARRGHLPSKRLSPTPLWFDGGGDLAGGGLSSRCYPGPAGRQASSGPEELTAPRMDGSPKSSRASAWARTRTGGRGEPEALGCPTSLCGFLCLSADRARQLAGGPVVNHLSRVGRLAYLLGLGTHMGRAYACPAHAADSHCGNRASPLVAFETVHRTAPSVRGCERFLHTSRSAGSPDRSVRILAVPSSTPRRRE